MNAERWHQIEALFEEAVEKPRKERTPFLNEVCGDDEELRAEVERLLKAEAADEGFLENAINGGLEIWNARSQGSDRRMGPYLLIERIGFGGMGDVYLAERDDREFQQRVAIKLIRPGLDTERILERFRRERQILARLEHPNIARLLDGGTTEEGLPYFVMEYIEGQPIDLDCDHKKVRIEDRLHLFIEVCAAVRYAHQNLVIHRDLKPSNILITEDGAVKLLDFGIAKLLSTTDSQIDLTFTSEQPLTPSYASPEQVCGDPVNTTSDVYSLGVVLYKLLTGRLPFDFKGTSRRQAEKIIEDSSAPLPSLIVQQPTAHVEDPSPQDLAAARGLQPQSLARRLSGDLDTIILTAMHKDPARRYSSPEALAADIERHLGGRPVLAHRDSFSYRSAKFIRRNKFKLLVVCAFLALIVSSLISRSFQMKRIADEHRQALIAMAFLESLFEGSDPSKARGEEISALHLLDEGAKKLDELEGEPLVQAQMYDTVGHVYYTLGAFEKAERHLEEALALRDRLLPQHAPLTARTLSRLATVQRVNSKLKPAEELQHRAVEMLRGVPEHRDWLAESLNDLALNLRWQSRYDEAEALFEEALDLYATSPKHGEQHPYFLTTLNNLALVQKDQQQFEAAEKNFRRLTALASRLYEDKPHPETAQYLNNLGAVLQDQGRYGDAEALYQQAYNMRLELFDQFPHPDIVGSLNNLGTVRFFQGNYEDSERSFREAVDRAQDLTDEKQELLAASSHNLAEVLKVKGQFEQAEEIYLQALQIRSDALGDEHPEVLRTLNNFAALLITKGDYLKAEESYRELIERYERISAPPAERALSLSNLALSKRYRGRYQEAYELLLNARALFTEAFDQQHPEVARMNAGIAGVLAYQGKLDEAEKLYRQALEQQERSLGPDHPRVATSLAGLGDVLTQLGRLEECQGVLEQAREIRLSVLAPDHWQVAETRSLLGACLRAKGESGPAETLLRESYRQIAEQRGERHPMSQEALARWRSPDDPAP